MKKIFICAAAVAMLGLAACSNKSAENADTAAIESAANDTLVMVEDSISVESVGQDSLQVTEQVNAAEVVTPAN